MRKGLTPRVLLALRQFNGLAGGGAISPHPASSRLGTIYVKFAPCRLGQNAYTVPQAVDPRPTSSAFPQRRPTAEAKGGILPDQHGEPSFSRGLAAGGHGFWR